MVRDFFHFRSRRNRFHRILQPGEVSRERESVEEESVLYTRLIITGLSPGKRRSTQRTRVDSALIIDPLHQ